MLLLLMSAPRRVCAANCRYVRVCAGGMCACMGYLPGGMCATCETSQAQKGRYVRPTLGMCGYVREVCAEVCAGAGNHRRHHHYHHHHDRHHHHRKSKNPPHIPPHIPPNRSRAHTSAHTSAMRPHIPRRQKAHIPQNSVIEMSPVYIYTYRQKWKSDSLDMLPKMSCTSVYPCFTCCQVSCYLVYMITKLLR